MMIIPVHSVQSVWERLATFFFPRAAACTLRMRRYVGESATPNIMAADGKMDLLRVRGLFVIFVWWGCGKEL